jgi:hypothetical protein
MNRNRVLLFCLAAVAYSGICPAPVVAQCPPKTTISDTLYNADGSLASGRVVIAWQTFLIGTCQVIAGQMTVNIMNGVLNAQLYPNSTAAPEGTSYRVTYALKSGRITTEYWVVPASTIPVPLASVRAPTVPVPNVMFGEAQVANLITDLSRKIELPSPCASGKALQSNGSSSPPQVNCVDPLSGTGSQHQINGLNLAANDPINFQDTSTIAVTNPTAGNVQAAVRDASVTAAKLSVTNPSAIQLSGLSDANIASAALSPNRVAGTAVVQSRSVGTSAPLSGGGDLSADRTISCLTCEVNTNKGAANGYASLNASSKVDQDPASAQTTPASSKIPLADATGKIADGWLSSNVSLLGPTIDLASEVNGQLPPANGGTGANNAATAGRYLRGSGTSFVTSSVAAAGAGSCTNQFVRATVDNASPTCATVSKADVTSTFVHNDQANTFGVGVKQTHQNSATTAGFNLASSADPSTLAQGDLWLNTDDLKWRGSAASQTAERQSNKNAANGYAGLNSSALVDLNRGGTNASTAQGAINTLSGLTTNGDLLFHDGTNATRLARGSNGQCLTATATTIVWSSCAGGGSNHNLLSATHTDTTTGTVARGDLVVGQGAAPSWQRLALGAANKVLTSDGTDAAWTMLAKAHLPTTAVYTDQANTWTTGAQDLGGATSLVVPKAAGANPTADGDERYDTTQKTFVVGGNGALTGAQPRVVKMTNCTTEGNCAAASGGNQVDAASGAQGTTETNFASNWSMPANFLFTNKAIQVCAVFQVTTNATAPNITVRLKAGTTVLVATATSAIFGNSLANKGSAYCFLAQGTAAPGASVNVEAGFMGTMSRGASTDLNQIAQPVTLATNAGQTIQISAQWGTATSGNKIQLRQFFVMEMN